MNKQRHKKCGSKLYYSEINDYWYCSQCDEIIENDDQVEE